MDVACPQNRLNAFEAFWALKCCAVIAAKFPPYFQHHALNRDSKVFDSTRDLIRLFLRLPAANKASAWRWLQQILAARCPWPAPSRDIYREFFYHAEGERAFLRG
jgi:hypothetical protein